MPTSVLLAVLVAAGLLALAPALVRRYDATERQVAEREWSTARVLTRRQRLTRACVPCGVTGPAPAPAVAGIPVVAPHVPPGRRRRGLRHRLRRRVRRLFAQPLLSRPAAELSADGRRRWWRYRRRRVLATLLALLLVQVAVGVALTPAFLVGAGSTVLLTLAYLVHLRNRALADARRRRAAAAAARRVEAEAEARRRRAAAAAARRAARRATQPPDAPHISYPYLRGRPYQARAANF